VYDAIDLIFIQKSLYFLIVDFFRKSTRVHERYFTAQPKVTFIETGSMIARNIVAMFPDRVISLALLSTTGGGFQCFSQVK